MPTIAVPTLEASGKTGAVVVLCTPDEYRKYMETNRIPQALISVAFLRLYLDKHGFDLASDDPKLLEKSSGEALLGDVHYYESIENRFITTENAKSYLRGCKLDYGDFINSYCDYLKSL